MTLNADGGTVDINALGLVDGNGPVTAGVDITADGGNMDFAAALDAGRDVLLTSTGNVTTGAAATIDADNNVTVNADGNVTIGATVTADSGVANGAGNVSINGDVDSDSAGDVVATALLTGENVTVTG